jgi:hypothetical protein
MLYRDFLDGLLLGSTGLFLRPRRESEGRNESQAAETYALHVRLLVDSPQP